MIAQFFEPPHKRIEDRVFLGVRKIRYVFHRNDFWLHRAYQSHEPIHWIPAFARLLGGQLASIKRGVRLAGAQPTNTRIGASPNNADSSLDVKRAIFFPMNFARLFFSNANLHDLSLSTPATTSKPSSFRACESPPIPQNKSTTFIFGFRRRLTRRDTLLDIILYSPRLNMNSVPYEPGITKVGYMNFRSVPSALPRES